VENWYQNIYELFIALRNFGAPRKSSNPSYTEEEVMEFTC